MQDITIEDLNRKIQQLDEENEKLRNKNPRIGKLPPLDASQI